MVLRNRKWSVEESMAEIKSALELAMEKSKKYVISDKEREEIKEKEVLQKATGLFHRYKEGHLSLSEMMREIERTDKKMREKVKEVLLLQSVDTLSLEEDAERLFSVFESIKGRSLNDVKEEFQNLRSIYQNEIEEARQKLSLQLVEALKDEGIDGDAVEPNVEGSEEWKGRVEEVNRSHREKLKEIKDALKRL
jgi:predicted Fe-Mo cluster-binding NifX family protein